MGIKESEKQEKSKNEETARAFEGVEVVGFKVLVTRAGIVRSVRSGVLVWDVAWHVAENVSCNLSHLGHVLQVVGS